MSKRKNIYDVVRYASVTMVNLQRDLHDVGLHDTARKINEASQRIGWEAAEKMRNESDRRRRR